MVIEPDSARVIGKQEPAKAVIVLPNRQNAKLTNAVFSLVDSQKDNVGSAQNVFWNELRDHIYRFQGYPVAVRLKQMQGTVVMGFAINHEDQIIDAWTQESSGYVVLDQEALATLVGAQPMPVMLGNTIESPEISVPARFS